MIEGACQMVQHVHPCAPFGWCDAAGLEMHVGERDRLDRLRHEAPFGIGIKVHAQHQPVVAADTHARHIRHAGVHEITEAVHHHPIADAGDARGHMGVVADHEIDLALRDGAGARDGAAARPTPPGRA